MRVAVLSDIHANAYALKAVLRECEKRKVDAFWLLGDYVDYCAATEPTLKTLQALNAVHIIAGNHDACLFDSDVRPSATEHGKVSYEYLRQHLQREPHVFEWLKSVSVCAMKIIEEQKIMLVHGTPDDPYWGKFAPDNPGQMDDIFAQMNKYGVITMFLGHSHKSFMLTDSGKTIINPGSVGQPRNGCPHAQYVIYEDGNVEFCSVPYDVAATVAEIKAAGLPEYLWQRLLSGK